jgi:hypothetical protein
MRLVVIVPPFARRFGGLDPRLFLALFHMAIAKDDVRSEIVDHTNW